MVFSVASLALRLSGESEDGSGVVPHEESRPLFDVNELVGEVTLEIDDPRFSLPCLSV